MSTLRYIQNPWLSDDVATTNATPAVSAATSYVVPSGASGRVEMTYVAKDGSQNTICGKVSRTFKNVGGVFSFSAVINILEALNGDVALATALANFTNSGTTIQPQVTGIAVTNIEWLLDVRYWVH